MRAPLDRSRFKHTLFITSAALLIAACHNDGASDGGADDPEAIPPVVHGRGEVRVAVANLDGGVSTTTSAYFVETSPATDPCTVRHSGACSVIHCPAGAMIPTRGAGTLRVFNEDGGMARLTYDGGAYEPQTQPGAAFAAEDLVSVIATGGEVEGFAGTVSFPDAVTITMPANGAPLTLDRSAGFPIAWQAFVAPDAGADTDAGDLAPPVPDVTVVIEQSGAAGTVSVRCNFPASQATSATVPADALSDLAATTNGAPATTVHVGAHVGDDALMAGGFVVRLAADSYAVSERADVQ